MALTEARAKAAGLGVKRLTFLIFDSLVVTKSGDWT